MKEKSYLGLVGLGTMGQNLALNIAEHGYSIVGYDRDPDQILALERASHGLPIQTAKNIQEMVANLETPRNVLILIPAGSPVDQVIQSLLPHLTEGDLIIDGGNSHFQDTDRRAADLQAHNLHYMGVGISGGEYGARHGPSIMPGGPPEIYPRVQAMFEASAAKVGGDACVTYLGPRSAGHYVKMVHNGIEYGFMQLIAESYDLMKRGMGLPPEKIHTTFSRWNDSDLDSYLVEITANILLTRDPKTGHLLLDLIKDSAEQNGTGMWTSQDALRLGVPTPTIDTSVAMRSLSKIREERKQASAILRGPDHTFPGVDGRSVELLGEALYAAQIILFAQGFSLLKAASEEYRYQLDLAKIADIWRGGCIIRSALLGTIDSAYVHQPDLINLLLDPKLSKEVNDQQRPLREIVTLATGLGVPVPAFMSSLAYFDAFRSSWLPANLIQAQRDYFGGHRYERLDEQGSFHTQWRSA